MAFVFTWLRLSAAKLLPWARRSAYQSKVGRAAGGAHQAAAAAAAAAATAAMRQ